MPRAARGSFEELPLFMKCPRNFLFKENAMKKVVSCREIKENSAGDPGK